jgi:hypothetical protein
MLQTMKLIGKKQISKTSGLIRSRVRLPYEQQLIPFLFRGQIGGRYTKEEYRLDSEKNTIFCIY